MKDAKKIWRKNNPVHAAWSILRCNARRRNIPFDISLSDFTSFCFKTQILVKRGIYSESYSIDRIDNDKGYTRGNIQILTNSQNAKKYHIKFVEGQGQMEDGFRVIPVMEMTEGNELL